MNEYLFSIALNLSVIATMGGFLAMGMAIAHLDTLRCS